jgi:hypothetical protein
MLTVTKILSVNVAALLFTSATHAATIHIQPGTDVFGTAAAALQPGDTLIVHQGTYLENNRMSLQMQGTAAAQIIIEGALGESRPVITRPGGASIQNTINIEGSARYLTIKGLEIIGNGGDGVNMSGANSYITIEDLVIHDIDVAVNFRSSLDHITVRRNHIYNTGALDGTGEGMYVGCNNASCIVRDSLIENNWIHDCLPGTTQGDGIEIKFGSHSNIIRDNVIYNRVYPGILAYGTGANPANIIEGNVVWNSLEGITAVSDAIVRNNIVIGSSSGISSYSHVQVAVRKNVTIANNTLYDNEDGLYLRWAGSGLSVVNNAIYSPGQNATNNTGTSVGTFSSNFVEGAMNGEATDGSRFSDGMSATAAFVAPAQYNFWPKAGSVLIGSAQSSASVTDDFNGTARNAPLDVGAYEINGLTSNPGWAIIAGFKQKGAPGLTAPAAPSGLSVH